MATKVKVKCDQCEMLSINGVSCHEIGCLNMDAKWIDGEWVKFYECFYCGFEVPKGEQCNCQDQLDDE